MKKLLFTTIVFILLNMTACTALKSDEQDTTPYQAEFFAMDTYMKITAYGKNGETAVEQAKSEAERLDSLLNAEQSGSEIYELNKNGTLSPSKDVLELLKKSVEYSRLTQGAFDPALHPVTKLWGFTTKKYHVPEEAEIKDKLKLSDPENILLTDSKAELKIKGMEVDLGGIAKGYTSSAIAKIFEKNAVKSGLINLGGNVRTVGKKTDGSDWSVAIENPDRSGDYLGVLKTHDKAVITSGGYERNFEKDGKVYHHIIDPSTGYPADNGLLSVTIVTDNDILADALSTALFVMGEKKAVDFWKNSSESFDIILYNKNNQLTVSGGIKDSFSTEQNVQYVEK